METRIFEYKDKLYSIGDYIEIDEKSWFYSSPKKYKIDFIGCDSSALVSDGNTKKTIIGKVNIYV